ncbi:MAG: type II CAAX endopeptidase family protein [Chloroflexota bacterium]
MIQETEQKWSEPPSQKEKRILTKLWDWKDIVPMVIIFGFLYLTTQVAAIFLAGAQLDLETGGFSTEPDTFLILVYGLLGTLIAMLVPIFLVNAIRKRYSLSSLGLGSIPHEWVWPAVGLGIAAALVRMLIAFVLLEQYPVLEESAQALSEVFEFDQNWQMIVAGLMATLIVPFYEEVFFRGVVHNGLANRLGMWGAIIVAAILFGLIHIFPIQIITAFLLGLVLGWLYEKSDNIWIPVLCHMVNNGIAMGLSILSIWLDWGI